MVRNRHFFRRVSAAASAEKAKTHLPMIVTIGGDKETFSPKRVGGAWRKYMAGRAMGHASRTWTKNRLAELEISHGFGRTLCWLRDFRLDCFRTERENFTLWL